MLRRRNVVIGSALGPLAAGAPAVAWPAMGSRPLQPASDGRTLHVAMPGAETSFDPPQIDSNSYSIRVIAQIFESPLCYDYLARPARLLPCTAEALPKVSADGRQLELRIRPGIFFSDDPAFGGRPRELVAQDYVYAIKRFFDPRLKSGDLHLLEDAGLLGLDGLRKRAIDTRQPFDYDTEVEGLRAPDRYTLRLAFREPQPRFVYHLAAPYLVGAVAREVVAKYGDEIGAHPVGTGAFRLQSWRRASRIVLERSPTWRGSTYDGQPADQPEAQAIAARLAGKTLPLVDRIQFDVIEEQQPIWLSFLNGQLDQLEVPGGFSTLAAPGRRIAPYLARRGVKLDLALAPDMSMTFFNCTDPVIGGLTPERVALRRAIALSHDGSQWSRLVRGGLAVPAQSVVAPGTSGYDPAYRSEMSEYSPARARALLDLYGYVDRNGDGWREQPDGSPLLLRIAGMGDQGQRRINELWRRSLQAVGQRVEFEHANWPDLLKKARAGALMMWGYAWAATSPDGGFFLGIGYGPHATESNDARFALPAYDRLYEQQRRLPDGPEREAVMRRAKSLLVAYMPYKVHGHRLQAELTQPWTHGYWRHPFMRDVYRFVEIDPH